MRNPFRRKISSDISEEATIKDSIYLSGPMTGIPHYNYPYFQHVWLAITDTGATCLSPHHVDGGDQVGENTAPQPYGYYFRKALRMMLVCEKIVMLPGWEDSKGATMELAAARLCGMKVGRWHDGKMTEGGFLTNGWIVWEDE